MTDTQEVREITLDDLHNRLASLEDKIDKLGELMDWLCTNMQGLFQFINQMGNSGGGIRGLLKAMNSTPATTTEIPIESDNNTGA